MTEATIIVWIFRFFRWIYRWIHRFANIFTEILSETLVKITDKLPNEDKVLRHSEIIQFIIVVAAFIFAADRFRLFCDICYTTPAGAIAGIFNSLRFKGSEITNADLINVYLGNSITWITCGVQAVFTAWYGQLLDRFEANKWRKLLGNILFTFFIGIVLTLIVSFLYGPESPVQSVLAVPLLGLIIKIILYAIMAITFVIALDNAFTNYKDSFGTAIFAIIIILIVGFVVEKIGLGQISIPNAIYDQFEELTLIAFVMLGYWISKKVFKSKPKKQDIKEEQVKWAIKYRINKKENGCCLCGGTLQNGYWILYKDAGGNEAKVDVNCYNAINTLGQSNDVYELKKAFKYMQAHMPKDDKQARAVLQPYLQRGYSLIKR